MQKQALLVSFAAGLASALLFAGLIAQTQGGAFLTFLAPLPIFIASLGWGSRAGFIAVVVAALAVILSSGSMLVSVPLVVAMAGPAAWIGHLAGLARPAGPEDARTGMPPLDWYPLSRILMGICLMAILGCIILGWMIGFNAQEFGPELANAFTASGTFSTEDEAQLRELTALAVRIIPFVQPALLVALLTFMLYLAAIITRASGRLNRPKDDIPSQAGLPRVALPIFAVALAVSFFGGVIGTVAAVVCGAFGMAFTLVGLAAMHRRTRTMSGRGLILFSAYAAIFLLSIPLFAFLIIGLVDVAKAGAEDRP